MVSEQRSRDAFDGEALDVVIPHALSGVRVDRALSMLTGLSRSEAHDAIASGAVRVDQLVIRKSSTPLVEGQHLTAALAPRPSLDVAADPSVVVEIVRDGGDFVVVNKAPGQVVHPGAGHRDGTVIAGLLARYPQLRALSDGGLCDPSRPGVVHRLDKGTSGLMVVATTPEGFLSLRGQLSDRLMERRYVAMVQGLVSDDRGIVDAPIGRSLRTPTMMSVRPDGRPARTSYEVIARTEGPEASSLLALRLETGRTHQIRVHLATIGHPVVNDLRYGHRRDHRLADERLFLHARSLVFRHPRNDEPVESLARMPGDLAALVPHELGL